MIYQRLLPKTNRDGKIVIAASAARSFGYGFLSVFLGVYLSILEFSPLQAGFVFSGIMAGGALSNLVASWKGDAIGRRRMLVIMSGLMVIGGVLFALTSSVVVLVLIGLIAMTTSTGGDRTAFVSLDTAIIAETCAARDRTTVFAWYNLVGYLTKAVGALLLILPPILQSRTGMEEVDAFKAMFFIYAVTAAGGILLYWYLSPAVESQGHDLPVTDKEKARSRGIILKMSALFSLDAFGGGLMTRAFMSFWFVNQFGASPGTVAIIFFVGQLLNVVSVSMASTVARLIGLINTMAFTQVLSNLFVIAMVFSPGLWSAVAMFFLRELSNDMDIPTRQSYTMAIVPPEARIAMASMSNLGRTTAQTVSPTIAGVVAQISFLGAPFVVGSGVKLVYNALLYLQFRGVAEPEEEDYFVSTTQASVSEQAENA